jgi:hypothetical protein
MDGFVYRCHILRHQDGGMMAIVDVLPETQQPGASDFRDAYL